MQSKKKLHCLGYPFIIAFLLLSLISSCSSSKYTTDDVFDDYSETYGDIMKSYSLYIANLSDIKLDDSVSEKSVAFYSDGTYDTSDKDEFDFVSEDEDVATVEYDEDSVIPGYMKITKVGSGETYVYIESKDGLAQTDKIKVTVAASETTVPPTTIPPTTVPTTVAPTTSAPTTVAPTTAAPAAEKPNNNYNYDYNNDYEDNNKSGRTVYITPYGEKYHLSKSCAGKNAMARDYNDVAGAYAPCKKCAQ